MSLSYRWAHACDPALYGKSDFRTPRLELRGLLTAMVSFPGDRDRASCELFPRNGWGPVQVDLTPGRHRFQFDRTYVEVLYWCRGANREGTPFQYLPITSGRGEGGEELAAVLYGSTPSAAEVRERWAELRAARYDTQALNTTRDRLAAVMARASRTRWGQPRPRP